MTLRRAARTVGILLGYGILFYCFDAQATFFEVAPGVSLWYPSAGLNLALVLTFGVAYVPAVFVMLLASGLWIAEPAIPLEHLILPDLVIAAGNGLAAWWLHRLMHDRTIFSPGAAVRLVGVTAGLAAWNAVLSVGSYLLTGLEGYTLDAAASLALSWWLGDWAGMLTLTPALLIAALALGPPRALAAWAGTQPPSWPNTLRARLELLGEAGAVVLSLYGAFYLHGAPYPLYLCFLPLLWIALRHGLPRSTWGVLLVNFGAVVALHGQNASEAILHLQLFIVALALTGLLLGALVSERDRAFRALQHTLTALERAAGRPPSAADSSTVSLDADASQVAARLRAEQEQLARSADALLSQNEQLRSTEATLKRQNARKNQLFSIIAHDLKNHIGSSTGLAEVLATEAATLPRATVEQFARHLHRSTRQAKELLDSLIEWARVYVTRIDEAQSEQAVAPLVADVVRHAEQAADRKAITLVQHIDEPDLTVRGHPTLLQTVLRNLVSNAIKYTERGGRVAVRVHARDDGVTFYVHDDGVGMSDETLNAVFHPTQRRSQPGTDDERGSGLGLALCREIVEQHGGTLWAESEPGEGSTFCFTIPHASAPRSAPH